MRTAEQSISRDGENDRRTQNLQAAVPRGARQVTGTGVGMASHWR